MSSESLNGILITGSSGQVGGGLVRAFTPHAQRFGLVHAPLRADLNLSDPDSIRRAVRALNFGLPRTLSATVGTCTHLSPRLGMGANSAPGLRRPEPSSGTCGYTQNADNPVSIACLPPPRTSPSSGTRHSAFCSSF
jgi:hypothetical protein